MKSNTFKARMAKWGLAASILMLASGAAFAQSVINLTAGPSSAALPDGQTVPMWGYSCGAVVSGSTATCAASNPNALTNWSPVVITVPVNTSGDTSLTISLTNNLPVPPGGTGIPTSLVIVGQLGGGLGSTPTTTPSPAHAPQGPTWPASGGADASITDCSAAGAASAAAAVGTNCPPPQPPRVQSFSTEVAQGATTALTWNKLKPGTYLIHSGTHPSIQAPMGLYGVLVVTTAPSGTTAGQAYTGVSYDADVPLVFGEIDPTQNRAVAAAVATAGFSETKPWSGLAGKCGDLLPSPTSVAGEANTCYPPAINYSPRYYLINGVSFDRTNLANSTLPILATPPATATAGSVLLRLVNAGLRMHVPSVVGQNMTLYAEDGNLLPGAPKGQSQVFLAAGKTYDVAIKPATAAGVYSAATYAIFDRQLSLSTNNQRDGGMQAYISVAGGAASGVGSAGSATSVSGLSAKKYYCVAGTTLAVTDPSIGVLGGVSGASGATLGTPSLPGSLDFQANGTFTYTPPASGPCAGSFTFLVNGTVALTQTATITQCDATVQGSGCTLGGAPVAYNDAYTSSIASQLRIAPPGILLNDSDPSGLPMTVDLTSITPPSGLTLNVNPDGSFTASTTSPNIYTFTYKAKNSQGVSSTTPAQVTLTFPAPSNLAVAVKDAKTGAAINDYRWIIEEDRTFHIDPACQVNATPRPATCPPLPVESLGYSFHTANMPVVATGCVGDVSCELGQTVLGQAAACDLGNGVCRTDATKKAQVTPDQVYLDPTKRYYLSVLPGDGINPTLAGTGGPVDTGKKDSLGNPIMRQFTIADCTSFAPGTGDCGHAMGGAPISGAQVAAGLKNVTVNLQQTPLPTAKIAVFVYQDDNPLNGENDAGGGVDVIAPNEPGLGGFELKLFDQAGGLGDNTGQITYDMFNMPVSNSLAGKIDPITGLNSCPITARTDGLVGMVPTCPKYESDGVTPSPLAGQAVIANLYPGLYEIQAYPAADRIGRGEEWLQTNTLDGGKPHEAFIRSNEPGYFQEFGPGGFHVSIGFANPQIINDRKAGVCAKMPCNANLNVQVTNSHMSRTPDQRTYSSETYDHYGFTQCYVSVGPADGEDFAFAKCNADGTASFTGMPTGVYKMSVFDQWNDIMLDGLVSTVTIDGSNTTKVFPVTQWRTNLFTRTFLDVGDGTTGSAADGVSQPNEPGLPLVMTNIRYRDGSIGFFNNTDLNGYAGFNEVFPFMNWLVVETYSTRYKPTGVHTVYDAGGPVDCSAQANALSMPCSTIAANLANTQERVPLPADLRVPGGRYCASADCPPGDAAGGSSGAVVPPQPFGTTQGWQGLLGQNSFIEFGLKPFKAGETGGISGQVIYASTRPFDDPALLLQLSWEPGVPRVKINLYQQGTAPDGSQKLALVDTTTSASWDDWAQGFRRDASGNLMTKTDGSYIPNMNCPGQDATSPFFATLKNSKQWLDTPDGSGNKKQLAYNSQFKCFDGWSQLNQIQPAPYDGMYKFPSVTSVNPATGKPALTNCSICVPNPDDGTPMLPPGKYVVEVIVPPGFELVKEEDKNILLGDIYIAPVTQQFAGLGNIFIMPDQAAVNAYYNKNNPINQTADFGLPRHEGDTGSIEQFWPCVGALRTVPDFNSLFPTSGQNAPFAGALRPLCDRKEVTLGEQTSALAKFYVFTNTHIAGHFTGNITNDFASEFDPFSPQFGEKFAPPNLPVALRDFNGNEVSRVYADQWGVYNGLYFSSYGVNPPNPTGYVPQMAIACMNDPGPINVGGTMVTDPAYIPAYSNFCYEIPFMPGFTAYLDTPVIPTQAFADGYNLPDTEYPDGTPAIKQVVSSAANGPWVMPGSAGVSATVQFTISSVDQAATGALPTITSVMVGATSITGATSIACSTSSCGGTNAVTRVNNMAALVVSRIGSGYTATRTTATTGNPTSTITITAPAGTFATLNGTAVAVTGISHLSASPTASQLAGGAAASPAAMNITITALGDKVVQNPNFSGPNATVAPYNQKTLTRHYGFGTTVGTVALVGSDGVTHPLTGVSWNDTTITGTVPAGLPNCTVTQQNQTPAQCGELVITRGDNGKRSIDAITVTVGGSAPWIVTESGVTAPSGKSVNDYGAAFGRMGASPIQTAIDSAASGDLILVRPGTYRENLIMWKPVRLQGVGAGSVTINADAHPAGKMDQWRRQMNCAFGLTLEGTVNLNNASFDATGQYSCPAAMHQRVDRIPFEAIVGWDASGNGNLAQVLQEPTLMGAYEGAGITVLGRGVRIPATSTDFWGQNATGGAGAFTDGSVWLTGSTADCAANTTQTNGRDYGTSNFYCNPSRIDGVSIINSSQGGGGVFIHGWAHNLDVANTRISGNHGTLAGAINLGNGETPDAFINDGVECGVNPAVMPCPPIPSGTATDAVIPFQFNTHVRIHHNMLYNNASIGDALFSGTPSGAGGITVSAGADYYQIDHNWIAGNLSTGDGGGLQHLGLSFNGKINSNYVLFNQSSNPTLPTSGGGIVIEGANLDRILSGIECGSTTDQDCPPGLGQGTGPGLVIDANLILGNSAESGSGGGLRIQQVNGTEFAAFQINPGQWYDVTVTNNIIANNVAGWDGGGVSIQDAMKVSFVNNTVVSNDTTASAGSLFKTLGAIMANTPPPGCNPTTDPTLPQDPSCTGADAPHGPQPAGLVVMAHTPNLIAALGPNTACPAGFGYSATLNGDCRSLSKPALANDLFYQNRSFRVDIVTMGTGLQSQQNLVALSPALNQTATGQCPSGANYWDIGLRTDDLAAKTIPAGTKLQLTNSILTGDPQAVITASTTNIVGGSSPVVAQFCNGARTAPESCSQLANGLGQSCHGYNAPAGASETTGLAQVFVFNGIKPTATVDEGHNWLNLTYGPLTLNRSAVQSGSTNPPELMVASAATGSAAGAYSILVGSPAENRGSNVAVNGVAPTTDFFGNPRPRSTANPVDIGAVEVQEATGSSLVAANPAPLLFTDVVAGTGTATRDLVLTNDGTTTFTVPAITLSSGFTRVGTGSFTGLPANCGTTLAAGVSCTIRVQWAVPATATTANVSGTVTIGALGAVANSPVTITANAVTATYTASASPSPLNVGNWAIGTTSAPTTLTVTNTGNSSLSNLTYTLGGGSPQPFSRPTGTAGGTCGATLAAGASCTVNVLFAPATAVAFNRTLTVANAAAPAAQRITPLTVNLAGTGVASRATLSITPDPMTITLISAAANPLDTNSVSMTGTVTLTNTCAAATCSNVSVTSVAVSQPSGTAIQYLFSIGALAGPDTCTGTAVAPGDSCTVSVRFTNLLGARGPNRTGTITFTDTGAGTTQSAGLIGIATP